MKTRYLPPYGGLERRPNDMPDLGTRKYDDDERTEIAIEYATYFTVISVNPGGWKRGESNYIRSEHLTLKAARIAAKTRYERDPRGRGMLIYAVIQYANSPIGSSFVVEDYPKVNNPYNREAKLAKRAGRPSTIPKSMRDMPEPGSLPRSERFFEPSPETYDEIKRKLEEMKVVGKGGSKVAIRYKNKGRY